MTCILPGNLAVMDAAGPSFSTWDPGHTNARATLSNNNLTVAGNNSTSNGQTRGTKSLNSGKKYFEATVNALGSSSSSAGVGFCNATWDTSTANTTYLGGDGAGNSWAFNAVPTAFYNNFHAGVQSPNGGTSIIPAVNDTIMVAVDLTTGSMYFGVNNTWSNNSGPGAGTPDWTFPGSGATTLYPASTVDLFTTAAQFTLNVGKTAFKYALPSGYTAWG
jgi:hypothetical protein